MTMNVKKPILLFLALLLPVGVFVFLKFFGKNEFAVPVLFTENIEQPVGCDAFTYTLPYAIHDSVMKQIPWSSDDSISLIVFLDSVVNKQEIRIQLNRVFTEFSGEKFSVCALTDKESGKVNLNDSRFILSVESANKVLKHCVFLLEGNNNTVLLDSRRRIRGQYAITDREEADRLILEMKIMLKQY